jgi:hypothetical protein
MPTKRTIQGSPAVAIEYDLDEKGTVVPLAFYDLSGKLPVKYVSVETKFPGEIFDQARVALEHQKVFDRDQQYLLALTEAGKHLPIEKVSRFDQGDLVQLSIDPTVDSVSKLAAIVAISLVISTSGKVSVDGQDVKSSLAVKKGTSVG